MTRPFGLRSSLALLLALASCGGGSTTQATRGSSADTPSEAIDEGQTAAPELEDDVDMGMSLGAEVMGVTCDASAEDRAYCEGSSVVECDDGEWKSVTCTAPQYCGELEGGNVGCYSETSNDPEPTPDPEPMTGCPMISGTYTVISTSGESCRDTPSIGVSAQGECEFLFTGAGDVGLRRIDSMGRCADCNENYAIQVSDGNLTLRAFLCTYTARIDTNP